MARLPPFPDIDWSEGGVLRARTFSDIYFSREGGLAESEAVFLGGCGLPDAWRERDRFAICELGFGTGLNVLAAWRAWKTTRRPHAILHISSIEAFLLARDDAARALEPFADVRDLAAKLIECWPVRAYAPQRLWFPEDGFVLTLHLGEARAILPTLSGNFDAWFLDGFAPARNGDMWNDDVFAQVARLSAPEARAATFTVAGDVRRGLERHGFIVAKRPGFGAKRERLEARRAVAKPHLETRPKRVAIIGAGIAGAACARALAVRNIETIVLDAAPDIGAGASGNPAGLVMPRLDRGGPLREVFLAAYIAAIRTYEALGVLESCGVEERARPGQEAALADLLRDPPLPEDWFAALPNGAALHGRAGTVRPHAAIEKMLHGAAVLFESAVSSLERAEEGWTLRAPDGRARLKADAVVLACGAALSSFKPAHFLPIEHSRGQIEWGGVAGEAPQRAITQGHYLAPYQGGVLFGATFDKLAGEGLVEAEASSRRQNLESLASMAPGVRARLVEVSLTSRASVRAATSDRAPLMGALPEADAWTPANDALHPGVFVLGGLGARGLAVSPLLGEDLASQMLGEPCVLSAAARDSIAPVRFLKRRARRG